MSQTLEGVQMNVNEFKNLIVTELLPYINLSVENPYDPILVENHSASWRTIGCGNYAGVFLHESFPEVVVKVYGRNHEELVKEIEVYKKLGKHEAFSSLHGYGETYLILKKLEGITLFNALIKGVQIPKIAIRDIDNGLEYARSVGLNPFDVHGKNVVIFEGRGYIVDVSDFYKQGYCHKWDDLKKAYHIIYRPFLYKSHPPIPFRVVDGIRKGYRMYRRIKRKLEKSNI
jgi:hypothetical protein